LILITVFFLLIIGLFVFLFLRLRREAIQTLSLHAFLNSTPSPLEDSSSKSILDTLNEFFEDHNDENTDDDGGFFGGGDDAGE
jgi:hypothetical protein